MDSISVKHGDRLQTSDPYLDSTSDLAGKHRTDSQLFLDLPRLIVSERTR